MSVADFNKPTAASTYVPNFLQELADKDLYSASMGAVSGLNAPATVMRFNRATNGFEEWDGAAWQVKTISVAGGGTGGVDSATARANLGIGSLGTQGAGAVNITGGTISGITALALTGNLTFNSDNAYDIGANAVRPRNVYIRSALVIPTGLNKYATS